MVPYPIVLPIPLPIPIPLPYEVFLKAAVKNQPQHQNANGRSSSSSNGDGTSSILCNDQRKFHTKSDDQPLDFTKEKITSRIMKMSDGESDDEDFKVSILDHDTDYKQLITDEISKTDSLKSKIQNLQPSNKRPFTKESTCENNRPLRKRKRIIDCDYIRLRDTNSNESDINPRKSI